jgi:Rps23 Pro-64 3,4-dihydroxylase Tpa1-like proline 4-hydroxylase
MITSLSSDSVENIMKISLPNNVEEIQALIDEYGFCYIDNFLPNNEFKICSELAVKAWKNKSENNWFLLLNNGQKLYRIYYDNNLVTEDAYNKLISYIEPEQYTYWYYTINHSDLELSPNYEKHPQRIIQNILLADKYKYIYGSLIDDWKAEVFSLTCYDEYSFISKHNDVGGTSEGEYRLTVILYLTPDIKESDGGYLLFHGPSGEVKIWPKANRLVLFKPKYEHEVRPVVRGHNVFRLAISGWLI